jgi:hypothetical protein
LLAKKKKGGGACENNKLYHKTGVMKTWLSMTGIIILCVLIQHTCFILWVSRVQITAQTAAIPRFHGLPQFLHTSVGTVLQNRLQPLCFTFQFNIQNYITYAAEEELLNNPTITPF